MSNNEADIRWRPKELRTFPVALPVDVITSIDRIAKYRDMSCEALVREYIGFGLREDLSRYFREQVMSVVEEALAKRLNAEETEAVLGEVRSAFRKGNPDARPRFRAIPGTDETRAQAD